MNFETTSEFFEGVYTDLRRARAKSLCLPGSPADSPYAPISKALDSVSDQKFSRGEACNVLELGPGLGEGMMALSSRHPECVFSGVCASDVELTSIRDSARDANVLNQVKPYRADFADPRIWRVFPRVDLVYAIDSLRWANVAELLVVVADHMASGSRLMVFDYFQRSPWDASAEYAALCAGAEIPFAVEFEESAKASGLAVEAHEDRSEPRAKSRMAGLPVISPLLRLMRPKEALSRFAASETLARRGLKSGQLSYSFYSIIKD